MEKKKKKTEDLLPVSKDCLQQGETQEEEEEMFHAAKRHFL